MNLTRVIEKIKNDDVLMQIRIFAQNNFPDAQIYAVGGVFRDFYLDYPNYDKDIVVCGVDVQNFAKLFAKSLEATFVELDDENKIYRIVLDDKVNFIDIAALVGDNIEQDLKRRDLTINAIAINLKTFDIIDISSGIEHLQERKIVGISEDNFLQDPLRLLRIFRFQAVLGFCVDEELKNIAKKYAVKINESAVERINYEFLKLFSGKVADKALFEMDETGLLKEILPQLQDLKSVPPNLHHHLNLFDHSIEVVKQIQILYSNSDKLVQEHLEATDFAAVSRLAHLKFAGLLHDIGKPQTWTIEEDTGRHRFIKHDDEGAKLASKLLKTNKFSKKQIEYVKKMIKFHIYPSHVVQSPELNEKIYMRFIRKMEEDSIDVIILAMADRLSARGVEITDEIVENNLSKLSSLLNFYLQIKDSLEPLPKLLSGNEIMDILGIKPSRELGEIIKLLKEAQISGEISTKEQAIEYVKSSVPCVSDIK